MFDKMYWGVMLGIMLVAVTDAISIMGEIARVIHS